MAYAAGVDVGSTQTKAVIIDEARRIVGRALIDTGANVMRAAENAFQAGADRRRRARGGSRVRDRHRLRPLQGDLRQHAGDRDQLPRPRRGAHVPAHAHRGRHGRAGHQGDPRRARRRDRRLLHERQVRGRHRTLPAAPRRPRSSIPLDELGADRAPRRAAGQDQHHLHRVRRVRGAVVARQGQEDRGHPARRAPVDRRALGRAAAARRDRGAR